MIKILGKPQCPYCDMAKQFLTAKGQSYEYIDITKDEDELQNFMNMGYKTVPQIWVNGKHVGGFDQLVQEKF